MAVDLQLPVESYQFCVVDNKHQQNRTNKHYVCWNIAFSLQYNYFCIPIRYLRFTYILLYMLYYTKQQQQQQQKIANDTPNKQVPRLRTTNELIENRGLFSLR